MTRPGLRLPPVLAAGLLLLGGARTAAPAEIGAFVAGASPKESWGTGWGGTLTVTLFGLVGAELEGAWQGSNLPSTSLSTLSAKAYLGPSLGGFVPYGGVGAGVYRESVLGASDTGTLGEAFLGVKLRFPFGMVIRGEFQWVDLPEAAPLGMDHRYFVGAGLSF